MRRLHVKFQSDPTVGLRIMIVAVKLHSCTFYIKIRIWPCLDRIIPSLYKMICPRVTNKLNVQFLSLLLKPLEFFSCQQSVPTTLDESSSRSISYIIMQRFFSSLSEACWALIAAVNTSSSCFISWHNSRVSLKHSEYPDTLTPLVLPSCCSCRTETNIK